MKKIEISIFKYENKVVGVDFTLKYNLEARIEVDWSNHPFSAVSSDEITHITDPLNGLSDISLHKE